MQNPPNTARRAADSLNADDRLNRQKLMDWLAACPTPWAADAHLRRLADSAGFRRIQAGDEAVRPGESGYFPLTGGGCVLFSAGTARPSVVQPLRIVCAHLDAPALELKPNAVVQAGGLARLAVEVYGGALIRTWFDRPLQLSGVAVAGTADGLCVRPVDLPHLRLILPNAPIHLNGSDDPGSPLNRQHTVLPFWGDFDAAVPAEEQLRQSIADALDWPASAIRDWRLRLIPADRVSATGAHGEWLSGYGMDDFALAEAAADALLEASGRPHSGLNVAVLANHEEVGSSTAAGAQSRAIRDIIERILTDLGVPVRDLGLHLAEAAIVSCDQAHAAHPGYADLYDAGHPVQVNGGPVLKVAASAAYGDDLAARAMIRALAQTAGIPLQTYVNNSNIRGGSTIGALISRQLPGHVVDIGNPLWAMHSACETVGIRDQSMMKRLLTAFYTCDRLPLASSGPC